MGKIKKEKMSKNFEEKKNRIDVSKKKANGERKKVSAEDATRKYGYISAKSVITMAEAAGFGGLQEEVAKNLAEDVTYRLRYIVQQCKKYMIHNRHHKLSSSDVNEVLQMCDASKIYGCMVDDPLHNFIYIKEADVYVLEDNIIDLPSWTLNEIKVQCRTPHSTSGFWVKSDELKDESTTKGDMVKGNNFNSKNPLHIDHSKQGVNLCTPVENQKPNTTSLSSETKIPTNLIKYYGITCNTILGHSDLKIAFHDLSKNNRILPIIPYLLNFITIALNKLGSERQIRRLLQTVEALAKNTSVDFCPYSATTRVINAMLLIVAMDKKPAKLSCSYHLRSYAARVLAMVLSQWCIRDEQKMSVDKKMGKLLMDFKASPKVHYGAIALLLAIGPDALSNNLHKIFKEYADFLCELKRSPDGYGKKDIAMLEEIILAAAASVYRDARSSGKTLSELDMYLYSYFGDGVCSIWTTIPKPVPLLPYQTKLGGLGSASTERKYSRILKYLNSRYRAEAEKLKLENVFTLPKARKKKNTRIMFKFAGAIPVPEVSLKRKRLDNNYSQFIAGKESEGHVVVAGKRCRISSCTSSLNTLTTILPVGSVYSVL